MDIKLFFIFLIGLLAGFINANAGGGSLITMPALIFLGLPPQVANGTNRIAVLLGAITASATFKKNDHLDTKFGLFLAVPTVIGAIIGASFVIQIPDRIFNIILACVMITVLIIIIINPTKKIKHDLSKMPLKRKLLTGFVFFFLGLYGGFIQAGIGILMITALLLLTNLPLTTINGTKVFIISIYLIFSIIIFILGGYINIIAAIAISTGTMIGSYYGSHFSIKKGDKWVRVILIIMVSIMAIKLSGIVEFLIK